MSLVGWVYSMIVQSCMRIRDIIQFTYTYMYIQMGISEVGTRKKILTGVAEVHKREWDMPSSALPHDKALR